MTQKAVLTGLGTLATIIAITQVFNVHGIRLFGLICAGCGVLAGLMWLAHQSQPPPSPVGLPAFGAPAPWLFRF